MMNHHHTPTPSPACLAIAALLPVLDEPELDAARVTDARAHLRDCAYCQAQRAFYTQLDEALRQRFAVTSTHHDTEDIMRSLIERSSEHTTTAPAPTPTRHRSMISRVAAIAAVVIIVTLAVLITHSFIGNTAGIGLNNFGGPQTSIANTQGVFASISMISSDEGWALAQITKTPAGQQSLNAVTLYHYLNGMWTPTVVITDVNFSDGGISGFNGTISMDSTTDGWAVAHNFNRVSVLLHYSNGQWTEEHIGQQYVAKVQAISPHSAWALVGSQPNATTPLHYDGTTWQPGPSIDNATDTHIGFLDITMFGDDTGWALVDASSPNSTTHALWRYLNGQWAAASTINTNALDSFSALKMVSPTEGWVIGAETVENTNGVTAYVPTKPLVYHFSNGAWHAVTLPNVGNSFPVLNMITMSASDDGWISGQVTSNYPGATTSNFRQRMFLLHYDGTQWRIVTPPPTGVSVDGITGIAITADGNAWACGYANDIAASKTVQDNDLMAGAAPLLLRYQNSTWSIYKQ